MVRFMGSIVAACLLMAAGAIPALAQEDIERALEKYRQMMKDDPWSNPGLLDADRGEDLWRRPRGPNYVGLETCDLGKGPGKVDGTFAELPRYFADADRVMDVETRLIWCMEKIQGFNRADLIKKPHPGGGQPVKDLGALATWIASRSNGMKFVSQQNHPKEKDAIALGEALLSRRSGPFDFACTTCHASPNQRIRLQALPYLANPEEARKVVGEWPAYRVSSTHVMTMQHRIYDCFWQMRMPQIEMGSEVSVALIAYLVKQADGGAITAPTIKR
jgi:sulfur-oxidizing protein SoxA